jgi:hypothetical protein
MCVCVCVYICVAISRRPSRSTVIRNQCIHPPAATRDKPASRETCTPIDPAAPSSSPALVEALAVCMCVCVCVYICVAISRRPSRSTVIRNQCIHPMTRDKPASRETCTPIDPAAPSSSPALVEALAEALGLRERLRKCLYQRWR